MLVFCLNESPNIKLRRPTLLYVHVVKEYFLNMLVVNNWIQDGVFVHFAYRGKCKCGRRWFMEEVAETSEKILETE